MTTTTTATRTNGATITSCRHTHQPERNPAITATTQAQQWIAPAQEASR